MQRLTVTQPVSRQQHACEYNAENQGIAEVTHRLCNRCVRSEDCECDRKKNDKDAYIEKTVHEKAGEALITVATNDRLEQTIVFGDGAQRMSASELYELMRDTSKKIEDIISSTGERLGNRPDIPEIRIK